MTKAERRAIRRVRWEIGRPDGYDICVHGPWEHERVERVPVGDHRDEEMQHRRRTLRSKAL